MMYSDNEQSDDEVMVDVFDTEDLGDVWLGVWLRWRDYVSEYALEMFDNYDGDEWVEFLELF